MVRPRIVMAMSLVLVLILMVTHGVSAQGPKGSVRAALTPLGTGFTYQGQLKQNGTAVNATCSFGFSLWDSPSAGNPIGMVQTQSLAVANGLFTSNPIDFGASAFQGDARYLEIAVQCPGDTSVTTLSRQNLTATPYALYAPSAGYASNGPFWSLGGNGGTNLNSFVGTTDNVTLTLRTNNVLGWRLAPNGTNTPHIIGGYSGNWVANSVYGATIAGGGASTEPNRVTFDYGVVGGGEGNQAGGHATVGGGFRNKAGGSYSVVGGGFKNTASSGSSTVGGGDVNTAANYAATIGGGSSNTVTGYGATIGGGIGNNAFGERATVAGGTANEANASYSFVAGSRAKNLNTAHTGVFLFADSSAFDFFSTAANQFRVRSTGGAQFVTAIDGSGNPTAGVQVASGGGSWSSLSDRNTKSNIKPINALDILARLSSLPIATWNYNSQDTAIQHIGPMAQDFYDVFQVGEDDRHISTVDADGVALAAIQGLNQVVQEKEAEVQKLQSQVSSLESQTAELRSQTAKQQTQVEELQLRIGALEEQAGASPLSSSPLGLMVGVLVAAVAIGRRRIGGEQ